jgi:hypothetical protein
MWGIFGLKENEKKFELLCFCVVQHFKDVQFIVAYYTNKTFTKQIISIDLFDETSHRIIQLV